MEEGEKYIPDSENKEPMPAFSMISEVVLPNMSRSEGKEWLLSVYSGEKRTRNSSKWQEISINPTFSRRLQEIAMGPDALFADAKFRTNDDAVFTGHKVQKKNHVMRSRFIEVLFHANSGFFEAFLGHISLTDNLDSPEISLSSLNSSEFSLVKSFIYGK